MIVSRPLSVRQKLLGGFGLILTLMLVGGIWTATELGKQGAANRALVPLLAAAVAAASVAAGWIIGRDILTQVADVTVVARRLEAGDLSARARVPSTDELGTLAATLNAMADRQLAGRDELLAANVALRESELRYRAIVEQQTDWIVRYRPDLTITFVNVAYAGLFRNDPSGIVGTSMGYLIADGDVNRLAGQLALLAPDAPSASFEVPSVQPDGSTNWLQWTDRAIFDEHGVLLEYQSVGRDVTERRRIQEALRESEDRFRRMSEAASEAIVVHEHGLTLDVNPAFTAMFGYTADERRGRPVTDVIAPESHSIARHYLDDQIEEPYEAVGLRRDGARFPMEIEGKAISIDGRVARVTLVRDVSRRKSLEERLIHQALHDSLTGLANRTHFEERLTHALARADRRQRSVAVMFVDLDNFKVVNDSLGHQIGDRLLVGVAERLRMSLRAGDMAARFGGDEFTILLADVAGPDDAVAAAERVADALRTPFTIDARDVYATASIGIAVGIPGVSEPVGLIREADLAMYRAKASGKARCEVFDPRMSLDAMERLELETDLRLAIERNELHVVYQPIWCLSTGRLTELEALLRWEHPVKGTISPARFIPIAEETGLIDSIGHWVLDRSCRQAVAWDDRLRGRPPFTMSVNLSIRQLQDRRLVTAVADVLRATGLAPARLKLEVTESAIMEDAPAAIARLGGLKCLGVKLAIDDFGTGYSSLSHLKRLPVDTLKIDRSFVDGLGSDPKDTAIVRGVIALAASLGLDVTAEGVETVAQLRALGCDRGQGYLFARPLAADAAGRLLADGSPSPYLNQSHDETRGHRTGDHVDSTVALV